MKVDLKTEYNGFPAIDVRNVIQRIIDYSESAAIQRISQYLETNSTHAHALLDRLHADGYVEKLKVGGEVIIQMTTRGTAFRMSRATKPISRTTAELKVAEFLLRVEAANANPEYCYFVDEVMVFGSFVTKKPTLGDVDIAVSYARKTVVDIEERARLRVETSEQNFKSFFDALAWPQTEVERFIKNGDRALSLHSLEAERDFIQDTGTFKIIYKLPDSASGQLIIRPRDKEAVKHSNRKLATNRTNATKGRG